MIPHTTHTFYGSLAVSIQSFGSDITSNLKVGQCIWYCKYMWPSATKCGSLRSIKIEEVTHHYFLHICMQKCDPCCQNETLLCTCQNLSSWYILPFIMVVRSLKVDNPISKVMPIDLWVLKGTKWRNQFSKFWVYHRVSWQLLGQKSSKLHCLGFKFNLKLSQYS